MMERATRHEAIVRPAHRRRRTVLVLALAMDVLAATALQGEPGARGYVVVLLVLLANAWLCCRGSDRVTLVVGDDGIASGRAFMPFSAIRSIATPFRRPGFLVVSLESGRKLAYVAAGRSDGAALRTRLFQQLAAYRHAANAPRPVFSVDAIAAARGAGYRRPATTPGLWSVLESPTAAPIHRARAALELRAGDCAPSDLFRMHATAAATAHPILRRLLLACAGHEELSPRAEQRLLRAL